MNVVGIMSGTSLDGIDFVLCKASAQKIIYKDRAYKKFPLKLRQSLEALAEGRVEFREAQKIHYKLGEYYYQSLKLIIKNKKWKIDLVGLHGQTVYHFPPLGTTQVGEPSYMTKLGVQVVSDFRSKLLVYKTQGAPLAPILHEAILNKEKSWGFLNLGGMSNLTLKRPNKALFASDFGTANVYLDRAVKDFFNKDYDQNGQLSRRGIADFKIVESYVKSHAYFKKKHPKSCGREDFSELDYMRLMKKMKGLTKYDILATLCEITLEPILKYLKKNPVSKLVVSGGGAKNQYFISRLKEETEGQVLTSEELGWPVEAIEGGAFALLAFRKIKGISTDFSYLGLNEKLSPLGRMD
jgi:anhydro-N-acetylmuramic acid kinase